MPVQYCHCLPFSMCSFLHLIRYPHCTSLLHILQSCVRPSGAEDFLQIEFIPGGAIAHALHYLRQSRPHRTLNVFYRTCWGYDTRTNEPTLALNRSTVLDHQFTGRKGSYKSTRNNWKKYQKTSLRHRTDVVPTQKSPR